MTEGVYSMIRDRLIDILTDNIPKTDNPLQFTSDEIVKRLADHLLENDVIVSPCKVGDTVWKIEDVWRLDGTYCREKEVVEFMVRSALISCNSKGVWTKKFRICRVINGKTVDHQRNIEFVDFGRTVFFSREEAEYAMKGGEKSKDYEELE